MGGKQYSACESVVPLALSSPSPYQTFQRATTTGSISVAGTLISGTHDIEASFNGGAYQTIATGASGSWSGILTDQAQGQGTLSVRPVDIPADVQTVANVGIGDVFIIAGQSNASGLISGAAGYTHATLKAGLFGNDYRWKDLIAPVDSTIGQIDNISNDVIVAGLTPDGSYWTRLATQIMALTGVPVAFVPCSCGSTSSTQWQPGGNHQDRSTLYGSMLHRALQCGSVAAVLFHQGESDATINGGIDRTTRTANLVALANAVYADLVVPLVAAKIHKWDDAPTTDQAHVDATNGAVDDAAGSAAHLLIGPNFNSPTNLTDGLHFSTDAHALDAATRWYDRLVALELIA
jgi:hypothetical protein